MRGFDLIIAKTEGGGFKVSVCGQADDHLMDWHGLNLRYVSVSGQPRRGFVTYAEADHFRQEIEANSEMMKRLRRIGEGSLGSYIPERRLAFLCECCGAVGTGSGIHCDDCPPPYRLSGPCAKHSP